MPVTQHDGRVIAFDDLGSGTPLLLGHSFLCSRLMWSAQVPGLSARYRVVNMDLRGHGESSPVRDPFTLYDMVDDGLAVLDELGIERAVWCGLSVGGMIALRAAVRRPDRVRALILVDTDAGPESPWKRFKYAAMAGMARHVGLRPLLPEIRKAMFGPTSRRTQPALVSEWSERFAAVDLGGVLAMLPAITGRDDLVPLLAGIEVPALVLVGSEDASLPPARSRRLATGLRRGQLTEIPGTGHLSAVERPDQVTGTMLGFLDGLGDDL